LTVQKIQEELKASATGEAIALNKHEQSIQTIDSLKKELAQMKSALVTSEETYDHLSFTS
jgi:hypothetical protein